MLAFCHTFEHAEYCARLPEIIESFAATLQDADPSARVPTCPDWTIAQLAEHVGGVHRWVAQMVSERAQARARPSDVDLQKPDAFGAIPDWLRAGSDLLTAGLRDGDPETSMWAWGADQHLRFWSRRMIFETRIHAIDLDRAVGRASETDAGLAADGVDEFLDNLPCASYFAPNVDELRGSGERIVLGATDAADAWTITLEPDRFDWRHADGDGDVTLEGRATDLLELAWGRRARDDAGFVIQGDDDLLRLWVEKSPI